MKRQKAIENLEEIKKALDDSMFQFNPKYMESLDMAIADMRRMQYLNGRPCTVCKAHSRNGCGLWSCVFNGKENNG